MKAMIRAVVASTVLAGAMTCIAAVNSRSYVQGGLVAQYDGIDNAGFGSHNGSATTWVNLAGNTALDGAVNPNVVWASDGWSVSTKCKPVVVGNALSQTTGSGRFTIQFACKPQTGANGGRQCFFSQYNASNSFGLEHNGTSIPSSIRLYCAGQSSTSPSPGGESLASAANSLARRRSRSSAFPSEGTRTRTPSRPTRSTTSLTAGRRRARFPARRAPGLRL